LPKSKSPKPIGLDYQPFTCKDLDLSCNSKTKDTLGPTCSLLNPKELYISVYNNYDNSEGIACIAEIYKNGLLVQSHYIPKEHSKNYKIALQRDCNSSYYSIRIISPSNQGVKSSKSILGIESGLSKSFSINSQSTQLNIGISRKQSILHDFLMKFNVNSNSKASGEKPIYELHSMSDVAKYKHEIENAARKWNVDKDIIKAIMYMETTHGYYDSLPALIEENDSILPMNIFSDYWSDIGYNRKKLKEIKNNINAGAYLLSKLSKRVNPYSIEALASLYQDLGAIRVTDYGARVKQIYINKLWIPKPSLLDKIKLRSKQFEELSTMEQINTLKRLFGRGY
jgi:hypothetical protein